MIAKMFNFPMNIHRISNTSENQYKIVVGIVIKLSGISRTNRLLIDKILQISIYYCCAASASGNRIMPEFVWKYGTTGKLR